MDHVYRDCHCGYVTVPCPGLAELVETGRVFDRSARQMLTHLLEPIADSEADALGLGCTHYPFLRGRIQRLVGPGVQVLDSGDAVARRVRAVLTERKALAPSGNQAAYTLHSTGDPGPIARAARRYLRLPESTRCLGVGDWSAAEIGSV